MKMVTVVCFNCRTPTKVSVKTRDLWAEDLRRPFHCNACLANRRQRAVADSQIAKADSSQRAFVIIQKHLNKPVPTYALPRNRPGQQAT